MDLWWEAADGRVSTYEWRIRGGSWTRWSNWTDTRSPSTAARVGALRNGTAYTFEVRARNGFVAGPASGQATTTPEVRHGDGWAIAFGNGTNGGGKGGCGNGGPGNGGGNGEQGGGNGGQGNGGGNGGCGQGGNGVGGQGGGNDGASGNTTAAPGAPTGLSVNPGNKSIHLSWTAPGGTVTDYEVCSKSSGHCNESTPGDWTSTGSTSTTYTVSGLTNGMQYRVEVRAKNGTNVGPATNHQVVTPTQATLSTRTLSVPENGAPGTYTIRLNSAPNADVTVTVRASSSRPPVTFTPSSLTFTTQNWNTAQTVTVTGIDDFISNIRGTSATGSRFVYLNHDFSGGGYSGTGDNVGVDVTDDDIIVNNIGKTSDPVDNNCSSPGCPQASSFTTGNHTNGYTLKSASVYFAFANSGGNYGTINEVAVYTDGTTGCKTGDYATTRCPGTRVGSALASSVSLYRTRGTARTFSSSAGIKLAANRTYWLVVDISRPGAIGMSASAAQDSTDNWGIGELLLAKASGKWQMFSLNQRTRMLTFALAASKNPAAPTGLTATAGNTQVTLNWTDPSDSTISKYQYCQKTGTDTCDESDAGDWTDMTGSGASTTSYRVKGLTNGTTYKFKIRAFVGGPGAASAEANASPAQSAAAQPTGLTATPGNASVDLSWTDPLDASITEYEYQSSTSSAFTGASWTDISGSDDETTTATVSGLTNDTQYYFRIRAVNNAGDGTASAAVNATPFGAPAAPTGFTATGKNAAVRLSWANPSNSTISKYQYQQNASNTFTDTTPAWRDITGSSATTTTYDVGSLSNGTQYYFRIRAVNSAGNGAASAAANATPTEVTLAAPTGLTAFPYDTSVSLWWTDPQESAITKYQVRHGTSSDLSSVGWSNISGSSATTTVASVGPLTKGTLYYIQLRAVAGTTNGPAASVSATPGAPATPYGLTATAGNAQVTLTWGQPYLYPPITKWQYCQTTGGATCAADRDWTDITGTNTTTRHVVTSLVNNTAYKFRLRAVNGSGNGNPSAEVTATPAASNTTPAAPTGVAIKAGNASVTLTWNALSDSTVTKFQYCKPSSRTATCTSWSDFSSGGSGHTATSGTVSSGLTNNTKYWFRVRAMNANGGGAASRALTATPMAAPVLQTPEVADRQATLVWSSVAGATLYNYCAKTDSSACAETDWLSVADEPETPNDDASTVRATVRGLTNDTTYTFKVRAINDAWTIVESNSVTVMPTSPPRRPTGLTATAGNGRVTLSWTAPPTGPYDGAATGYEYCQKTDSSACGDGDWTSAGSTTTKVVSGLTNGVTYTFRVRGTNGATEKGNPSYPVTATPSAPTGRGR